MGHDSKGSWVPSVALRVGAGRVRVAALLLGADGRVRGDADMVFDGQPVHPSGAARHENGSLVLVLPEVEAEVERIVVAGSAGGGSLAALAPDRAVVATLMVTGADDASAVVFGEFFRESGGWKFGGLGKGYVSGLAGLVTEYGVDVAEEPPVAEVTDGPAPGPWEKPVAEVTGRPAPGSWQKPVAEAAAAAPTAAPVAGPVALTGVAKVPVHAPPTAGWHRGAPHGTAGPGAPGASGAAEPARTSGAAPGPTGGPDTSVFPPVEREYRLLDGWDFGPVFEPFTVEGRANDVVSTPSRVPPGLVLVELAHRGGGYVGLNPLDEQNKSLRYLFNSTLPDFRGSRVVPSPEGRPLRMRLQADGDWVLRVKPVAAARRLAGTLRGYCDEALLHTGGPADLQVEFEGDPTANGGGYVGINGHEVAGRADLTGPHTLLLNSADGRGRHTVPVPPGPLLLLLRADGPWTLTLRETAGWAPAQSR
ncbi:TerD family protein [Streptomyces sp. NBC_00691]|uniref:TerD family protein n=1 Tax=Streptomyces sp. NBC_00691 TaxID=2903671 RepID=UPI002E330ECC|nr:TerD family protein [Streptomyces sp. NBC_00691]